MDMKKHFPIALFLLTEIASVFFILYTRVELPELVASHFNGAGTANGFMSSTFYVRFMLGMVIGVPCVVTLPVYLMLAVAPSSINLPNRSYWLSEENRERTVQVLRTQAALIGALCASLMVYVHWLVIQANRLQPPQLPTHSFLVGAVLFVAMMLVLVLWPVQVFGRVPDAGKR
jgi:uncharacterized membrane protein